MGMKMVIVFPRYSQVIKFTGNFTEVEKYFHGLLDKDANVKIEESNDAEYNAHVLYPVMDEFGKYQEFKKLAVDRVFKISLYNPVGDNRNRLKKMRAAIADACRQNGATEDEISGFFSRITNGDHLSPFWRGVGAWVTLNLVIISDDCDSKGFYYTFKDIQKWLSVNNIFHS